MKRVREERKGIGINEETMKKKRRVNCKGKGSGGGREIKGKVK